MKSCGFCYQRGVQDLLADGKTPHESGFGDPFKGRVISFGAMVEYYPISAKDQSRLHQFCKKVLQAYSSGMHSSRWKFGKEISWSQILRNWKTWTRQKSVLEGSLAPQRGDYFTILVADGTAKLSGGDHEFREPTLRREQPVWSEDLSGELQGEPECPQPTESTDDAEVRNDFWSMEGDFICRHHVEPRVHVYVPQEQSFQSR